jgi:hypothetical protein
VAFPQDFILFRFLFTQSLFFSLMAGPFPLVLMSFFRLHP